MLFTGVIHLYLWCEFNLFRDVKVAGVASFYKLSFSQDVYRNKSFERFWLPKSVEDEKKCVDDAVLKSTAYKTK